MQGCYFRLGKLSAGMPSVRMWSDVCGRVQACRYAIRHNTASLGARLKQQGRSHRADQGTGGSHITSFGVLLKRYLERHGFLFGRRLISGGADMLLLCGATYWRGVHPPKLS